MSSEHSFLSNNSFKSHLNAKSFNIFLTTTVRSNSASVSAARVMRMYKDDVNSALGET